MMQMIGPAPVAIPYRVPDNWIEYDYMGVVEELIDAKNAVASLKAVPFQLSWIEELRKTQLKMEVAGTAQIEGAYFSVSELDTAMKAENVEELVTRSQRRANSAARAYKWIAQIADDVPITSQIVCDIHRLIVTGCDDDHCLPGKLRGLEHDASFGVPRHLGSAGGPDSVSLLESLAREAQTTFQEHDPLIQGLALHYHFVAMHPFSDGNGRTARALEALILQRMGLKDCLFTAMSNYYCEEKRSYLEILASVRARGHDLTAFLKFGLKGVAIQAGRLSQIIKNTVEKEIFKNLIRELFARAQSTRKGVIVKRQLTLLDRISKYDPPQKLSVLVDSVKEHYDTHKNPFDAVVRDLNRLYGLGAICVEQGDDLTAANSYIAANFDWPKTITDEDFFARLALLPKSRADASLATQRTR